MARFRATIQGTRGAASRLGHRELTANVNGWRAGIRVHVRPCFKCEKGDLFTATATAGSGYGSAPETNDITFCSNGCDFSPKELR